MGLSDELKSLPTARPHNPGPMCTVLSIMERLDIDERDHLETMIDNPQVSGASIAHVLTRNGYPVSSRTVLRHRYRQTATGCRCPRAAS